MTTVQDDPKTAPILVQGSGGQGDDVSPRDEQLAEGLDDIGSLEFPRHTDRQALTAELVDDAQHPERLSIVGTICDEVIGPDMIGTLRAQTDA